VLVNSLMAEWLTNLHSFLVITTNHAGEDMYAFDEPVTEGKGEFYFRQVVGSTNFRTGSDFNDFLHGFLNYQIEHHVFPDMSMLQYQRMQPAVKALCERYGVPYVQESGAHAAAEDAGGDAGRRGHAAGGTTRGRARLSRVALSAARPGRWAPWEGCC
jgi:fatty acid desaturase